MRRFPEILSTIQHEPAIALSAAIFVVSVATCVWVAMTVDTSREQPARETDDGQPLERRTRPYRPGRPGRSEAEEPQLPPPAREGRLPRGAA